MMFMAWVGVKNTKIYEDDKPGILAK